MSIPAEAYCDHATGSNPRSVGSCVKCGRKLVPPLVLTVGEAVELLNVLHANPRTWNRKLRDTLTRELGPQNIRP